MLSVALLVAGAQPSKNQLVLGKLAALEGELEMLKPTKMERSGDTEIMDCMTCMFKKCVEIEGHGRLRLECGNSACFDECEPLTEAPDAPATSCDACNSSPGFLDCMATGPKSGLARGSWANTCRAKVCPDACD